MNRRKFLKFLGKGAVVSGVAVATGLPELKEPETIQSLPSDTSWQPNKIARWWDGLGNSWEKNPDDKEWEQVSFASSFHGEAVFIEDGLTYTEEI